MQQEQPERGDALGPLEWLKRIPFEPAASSDRLGWTGLEQMAAVAHLSSYHFARQFKRATGLPPHQYVIMRRVERARQLLQDSSDIPLAQIAARAGFSDQSQFSHHFKRLVGVTPGQFRTPARMDS